MADQRKRIPIPSSSRIAIPGREGEFFEPRDLSTTPGGTIYGVTPGGTRIVYDRETLLALRNSPMSQTPPKDMAKIPGVTAPADESTHQQKKDAAPAAAKPAASEKKKPAAASTTFNMDDD